MNPELVPVVRFHDIICPHCTAALEVKWERDDPEIGEITANCGQCLKPIKFESESKVEYTVFAWQDPDP